MNKILFASILAIWINQSFACECGDQLASDPSYKSKYEGKLSRFPWFTNVIVNNKVSCGAALIDNQHVATSVHCVNSSKAESITVQLNDKSMQSVSSIWVDSQYDSKTRGYDFAILTLSSPVDSQIKPVCVTDEYPGAERFNLVTRVSPKNGGAVESYPIDSPDPKGQGNRVSALTTAFGTEGFECNDGFYTIRSERKQVFLGPLAACTEKFNEAYFTDATKYAEQIKLMAPNACWKKVKLI